MRFDEVTYAKSTMSNTIGYLELKENGDVTFTKYKNQITGSVHFLAWIFIQIYLAFQKDKLLLTIPKGTVTNATFTLGDKGNIIGIGFKWSDLVITTAEGEYKFLSSPITQEANTDRYMQFVNTIMGVM